MKRLRIGGILAAYAVLGFALSAAGHGVAATKGGVQIRNAATATYADPAGATYTTQSNTVESTVADVASLAVNPKERVANPSTDSIPAGETIARVFTITNTSNISDAYRITSVKLTAGKLLSLAFTGKGAPVPIVVGQTVSPDVRAGSYVKVTAQVATTGLSAGQSASLTIVAETTAGGTANGKQHDEGEQWIVVVSGPSFNGPGGKNTRVEKTVDHLPSVHSASGSVVTFDVIAVNSGGAAATNSIVTDDVPAGLTPVAAGAKVNGAGAPATVKGNEIVIRAGTVQPGEKLDVSFPAVVESAAVLGATFVNTASLSADGVPPITTTPASVLIGNANVVYDAYGGGSMPISDAHIALVDATGAPVKISKTDNPALTGADGVYDFPFPAGRVTTGGTRLFLIVSASGYLNRRIQLDLTPGAQGMLYNVHVTALDNQSLALPGQFALTNKAVQLQNVLGLFGNIPLFSSQSLTVSKTSDRQVAQPGDRVMYSVTFSNPSHAPLNGVTILDQMPPGIVYATGTARIDGAPAEPVVRGSVLQWSLSTLAVGAGHTISYAGVVYPNAPAGANLTNTVTVRGTARGGGVQNATSSASVQVIAGVFTQRSVITGRVFIDTAGTGHFRRGDRALSNVRIYLEDGSSVLTDGDGKYSFPSVRPGEHVLRLDLTTLPQNVRPFADAPPNSARTLQRLVHGLLDDGLMQDVNFALEGAP